MKYARSFIPGLILTLTLAFSGWNPAAAETITLKLATYDPKTAVTVSAIPTFIKLVEEKSKGKLKVDWIGGPEVTPGNKQPAAVQKGVLDMSVAWAYVLHVKAFEACTSPCSLRPRNGRADSTTFSWRSSRRPAFAIWDGPHRPRPTCSFPRKRRKSPRI